MDMETKLWLCERDIIALVSRVASMHETILAQGETLQQLATVVGKVCDRTVGPEILKDGDVISPIGHDDDGVAREIFECLGGVIDDRQDRFDGVPADTR